MDTNTYNQIETTWTNLINQAKTKLDNVLTTEDLLNLSVRDLKDLISFCRSFQSDMDALFEDYRHIIGMGECTVIQRTKLTTLLREIEQYRSDTKRIATIKDLDLIKLIPAQSTYKLKLNSDIKLTSKLRPGQTEAVTTIEEASIAKPAEVKQAESTSGHYDLIQVDNETIEVKFKNEESNLQAVANLFAKINCCGATKTSKLLYILLTRPTYHNCIIRQEDDQFIITVEGKPRTKSMFDRLRKIKEK